MRLRYRVENLVRRHVLGTVSVAAHLLASSFKLLSPVANIREYALPYYRAMANKIDFNGKHLGKGDPLPPFNGKVRLYNMRYCPFAQRAILALNAKQIDYEVINIDLMNKPEWIHTKSGFGKIPAVEIEENVCIYESLVTVEYIDDYFPQRRRLQASDPARRAFDKIIIEAMSPVIALFFKCIKVPETITEDATAAYYKALDFLQEQLRSRGTEFLGGSEPGFADYMMWPWFERILTLDGLDGKMTISADKYKLLLEYFGRMFKDPAVTPYLVPKEVLQKFCALYLKGTKINYDTFYKN